MGETIIWLEKDGKVRMSQEEFDKLVRMANESELHRRNQERVCDYYALLELAVGIDIKLAQALARKIKAKFRERPRYIIGIDPAKDAAHRGRKK